MLILNYHRLFRWLHFSLPSPLLVYIITMVLCLYDVSFEFFIIIFSLVHIEVFFLKFRTSVKLFIGCGSILYTSVIFYFRWKILLCLDFCSTFLDWHGGRSLCAHITFLSTNMMVGDVWINRKCFAALPQKLAEFDCVDQNHIFSIRLINTELDTSILRSLWYVPPISWFRSYSI